MPLFRSRSGAPWSLGPDLLVHEETRRCTDDLVARWLADGDKLAWARGQGWPDAAAVLELVARAMVLRGDDDDPDHHAGRPPAPTRTRTGTRSATAAATRGYRTARRMPFDRWEHIAAVAVARHRDMLGSVMPAGAELTTDRNHGDGAPGASGVV